MRAILKPIHTANLLDLFILLSQTRTILLRQVTKGIMQLADAFCIGLQKISDLEVMGQPEMSVIAFRSTSNRLNIYQVQLFS